MIDHPHFDPGPADAMVRRAVEEEREACAKIADRQAWSHARHGVENGPELNSAAIADAIRSRGA